MTITIRPLTPEDKAGWELLYAGYAKFYGVTQTAQMRQTVWDWLQDDTHEVNGLVAEREGELIGLAHFRPFYAPLAAQKRGFLDDLYVDPAARGSGAAAALIKGVSDEGRKCGWALIRWITAENNYRARGLYDQVATQTPWVTYDIPL